jgi:solute carrier family 25 phosphate transporter 3
MTNGRRRQLLLAWFVKLVIVQYLIGRTNAFVELKPHPKPSDEFHQPRRYIIETTPTSYNCPVPYSDEKFLIHASTRHFLLTTLAVSLPVLLLAPFIAIAIDHPVDQDVLRVPIPVPDYRYFVSGGICAAVSHGITTPIDVVKTRIQADPAKFERMNLLESVNTILQQDGAGALLGGLAPTIAGYGIEGSAKFGLYESLKPVFSDLASTQAAGFLLASVVAGATASLLLVPLEQTRIRLVTEPDFADGLFPALSRLVREEGIISVFLGGFPAMLSKQVPYTFAKQVSFDVFASMLYLFAYQANLAPVDIKAEVSIAAAFAASILACIASHPGDVILTDTYKKGEVIGGRIPRLGNVIATIYNSQGLAGFFTGLTARFFHVGAIITSQLVLYDYVKQLLGLPATGT